MSEKSENIKENAIQCNGSDDTIKKTSEEKDLLSRQKNIAKKVAITASAVDFALSQSIDTSASACADGECTGLAVMEDVILRAMVDVKVPVRADVLQNATDVRHVQEIVTFHAAVAAAALVSSAASVRQAAPMEDNYK